MHKAFVFYALGLIVLSPCLVALPGCSDTDAERRRTTEILETKIQIEIQKQKVLEQKIILATVDATPPLPETATEAQKEDRRRAHKFLRGQAKAKLTVFQQHLEKLEQGLARLQE